MLNNALVSWQVVAMCVSSERNPCQDKPMDLVCGVPRLPTDGNANYSRSLF